jgi:muconolactone delta-isomerase
MPALKDNIKQLLRDVAKFCRYGSGLTLRKYQLEPAKAIVDSVIHKRGLSFVVIFPRQSGKNELQAQIQTYLLTIFSMLEAEMVSVSPTWNPQAHNAMRRIERVLSNNLITRDMWEKHHDYIFRVGKARIYFLSGSPSANIVGATANILLSIDEAQDIQMDKFDKDIAPMAASTNATRVFWGTAWTSNTLLAREYALAKALQEKDGIQRVWRLSVDHVAPEVPAYGKFVAEQVAKLGRNHPMVKTQYYSEDIDAQGGLFPPSRIALLYGIHPPQSTPLRGPIYVMTLDVAGEDENENDVKNLSNPARDATALTIAEVDLSTVEDPGLLLPTYRVVFRRKWVGVKHTKIYSQILAYAESWRIRYLVVDATGVGAGLSAFLSRSLGSKVIPFVFNARTKSSLGWSFLAMIDSGRIKDYGLDELSAIKAHQRSAERHESPVDTKRQHHEMLPKPPAGAKQSQAEGASRPISAVPTTGVVGQTAPKPHANQELFDLQTEFFRQLEYCQYEIVPGPQKQIRWSVPDGTRDPASGDLIHDDLMISAAMLSLLDDQPWSITGQSEIIKARDPLDDMKGF